MSDDPVVLALRAALAKGDSLEVRLALAAHLSNRADAAAALSEYEAALRLDPTHRAALEGAAAAASKAGDEAKATAYLVALSAGAPADANPASPASTEIAPAPAAEQPAQAAPRETATGSRLRLVSDGGAPVEDAEERPQLRFEDVAGMEEVKERLNRSFLAPIRNPDMFRKFGKKIGGGLVLYGPPGCGKTYLARALAGEIGASFVNVALSEVLDMWFGESEKRLHELFENARRRQPTVVFFDEVDALGQRRTQLKGSAGRTLVNQLLSELDGAGGRNEGIFVLGATNHPWDLDPALRRPGRFDRLLFVPPPDERARLRILELGLRERPCVPGLDLAAVAKKTAGYSGADLAAVIESATELAVDRNLRTGNEEPIDAAVLFRALADAKPSTRPWFETARNYAIYANEGGVYDELLGHLKSLGLG